MPSGRTVNKTDALESKPLPRSLDSQMLQTPGIRGRLVSRLLKYGYQQGKTAAGTWD